MSPKELDRTVLRYLESGDPDALAALYLAFLPGLRRRARRYGVPPTEVLDLVHEVFLTAIERKESFVCGRDFGAWLGGILRNKVRKYEERRRRWVDPGRLGPRRECEVSAAVRAEVRELEGRARRAVAELGSPYREVLELALFEGLTPATIAEQLGRNPVAVRVQLHRGLKRLRRGLPLALGALLTGGGRGLRAAPPLGVLVPSGVAALVIAGTLVLHRPRAPAPPGAPALLAAGGELRAPGAPVREAAGAGPRRGSGPARTARLPGPARSLVLEFRWRENGRPAPGIAVRLLPDPAADPSFEARYAVSGPDGRAVFGDLRGREVLLDTDRGPPVTLRLGAERRTVRRFDVTAQPLATGVVVDAAGRPVARARIWVSFDEDGSREGWIVAGADAKGRFRLPGLRPGQAVAAFVPGRRPSAPVRFDGRSPLRLQVGNPGSGAGLSGFVVDGRGRPVPGALVSAGRDDRLKLLPVHPLAGARPEPPPLRTRTDATGAFSFAGLAPGRCPVVARIPGAAPAVAEVLLAAHATGSCLLRMPAGRRVELRVVDQEGEPVPGALVRVQSGRPWETAGGRTDRRGRLVLAGVSTEAVRISVVGPAHAPAACVLEAGTEAVRRSLELTSLPRLEGRLLDEAGRPLPGCALSCRNFFVRAGLGATFSARTDANGRFELPVPEVERLMLAVRERGAREPVALVLEDLPEQLGEGEVVLRLPDRLRARSGFVARLAGRPPFPRLWVRRLPAGSPIPVVVGRGGRIEIRGLLPALYRLEALGSNGRRRVLVPEISLQPGLTLDLGLLAGPGGLGDGTRESGGLSSGARAVEFRLVVLPPPGAALPSRCRLMLRGACFPGGRWVEPLVRRPPLPFEVGLRLPPGGYAVVVEASAQRYRGRFFVPDGGPGLDRIEVQLVAESGARRTGRSGAR